MLRRPFLITAALIVSGCNTGPVPSEIPADATPKSVVELRNEVETANPGTAGFRLLMENEGRFTFWGDNRVDFEPFNVGQISPAKSVIQVAKGQRICVSPNAAWRGACIDISRLPSGEMFCSGVYGTGKSWRSRCSAEPIFP